LSMNILAPGRVANREHYAIHIHQIDRGTSQRPNCLTSSQTVVGPCH
jgi:hypothetical protein